MFADWNVLSEPEQLMLSQKALCSASHAIARQAEMLARQIENGLLADRGGPEALRLLACLVRMAGRNPAVPAGHG